MKKEKSGILCELMVAALCLCACQITLEDEEIFNPADLSLHETVETEESENHAQNNPESDTASEPLLLFGPELPPKPEPVKYQLKAVAENEGLYEVEMLSNAAEEGKS